VKIQRQAASTHNAIISSWNVRSAISGSVPGPAVPMAGSVTVALADAVGLPLDAARGWRAVAHHPRSQALPRRGRRIPGGRVGIQRGRILRPVPRNARQRGRQMPADRPFSSGVAKRQGNELRTAARLHPEQNRVLSILLCIGNGLAEFRRGRNRLAAHIENDIANL